MKALDTNVLVRLLVADDEEMAAAAVSVLEKAVEGREPLVVSGLVLLELNWVLRAVYDFERTEILDALVALGRMPSLQFESMRFVEEVVRLGRQTNLDLSDLLIGVYAREAGCEATLTFDRRAARHPIFEAITT